MFNFTSTYPHSGRRVKQQTLSKTDVKIIYEKSKTHIHSQLSELMISRTRHSRSDLLACQLKFDDNKKRLQNNKCKNKQQRTSC
jgi:hypothetical protein